jgi:RNA polymerase sigma-70 factor (ECF subfamily)
VEFLTDLESCIPSLRRYARALLRDSDRADDLVQDCLERALSRRHLWQGGASLRPWLFRIMHNIFANQARALSIRPRLEPIEDAGDVAAGTQPQHGHMALAEMAKALGELPDGQRRVVLLVALEGLAYQEVADLLDIPIGTVMSRLSRGRERLRQLTLGEAAPGAPLRRVK